MFGFKRHPGHVLVHNASYQCAESKAKAAVLEVEGQYQDSIAEAAQAIDHCNRLGDAGIAAAIRMEMQELMARATDLARRTS